MGSGAVVGNAKDEATKLREIVGLKFGHGATTIKLDDIHYGAGIEADSVFRRK
jgi:hypothetical protein